MAINDWIKKCKKFLLALVIMILLVNCTIVQKPFKFKDHAVEYAESIFRRQNQATQQVMILLEDDLTTEEEERLSEAELQMYKACHLLNEAANREMEGKNISVYFQGQVKLSFKACDESVKNMESILRNLE